MGARDRPRLAPEGVSHDEAVGSGCGIDRRVARRVCIARQEIIERVGRIGCVWNELRHHLPGDGPALIADGRRVEADQPATFGDIELPAEPDQGEAPAHQEAVAKLSLCGRIGNRRREIEIAQHILAAPVGDIEQRHAVAPRGLFRYQRKEIGREGHAPGGIPRRLVDVDNRPVCRKCWVEGKEHLADDLLVRTGGTEQLATEHVRP